MEEDKGSGQRSQNVNRFAVSLSQQDFPPIANLKSPTISNGFASKVSWLPFYRSKETNSVHSNNQFKKTRDDLELKDRGLATLTILKSLNIADKTLVADINPPSSS